MKKPLQQTRTGSPHHSNSNTLNASAKHPMNADRESISRWIAPRACLLMCALLLNACGPSEQKKAEIAERKRIECLNRICDNDVMPARDYTKYEILKFNGQMYLGPKYYYSSGTNGASFFWPSKKNRNEIPKEELEFRGHHRIEIFIRGRARWPDEIKNDPTPWQRKNGEPSFDEEMKKEGFHAETQLLTSDLEHTKYVDAIGNTGMHEVFSAIKERDPLSGENPRIFCRSRNSTKTIDESSICTGGFFWPEDLYVDFRMSGKYVHDWPEIYKEIVRVLQLLKKA